MADLTTATPLFGIPTAKFTDMPMPTPTTPSMPQAPKKHGTVDNILGFLGDFLTSRLHMGTPYHDARENEKRQAAIAGVDPNDPRSVEQGYQNLARVDFNGANKWRDTLTDNRRLQVVADQTAQAREERIAIQKQAATEAIRQRLKATMNTVLREKDPKKQAALYSAVRSSAIDGASKAAPDNNWASELPEAYNPDVLTAYVTGAVPVATQNAQAETHDYHQAMDQNADNRDATANRGITVRDNRAAAGQAISAARAARGPAGRKPTEGDIVQGLIDSKTPLTPGQKARVTKYTNGVTKPNILDRLGGGKPAPKAKTIKQNGFTYTQQPDGSYK